MLLLRLYFALSQLFIFTHSSPREALMMFEISLIKMAGYIWAHSCVMGLPLGFLFRRGVLLEMKRDFACIKVLCFGVGFFFPKLLKKDNPVALRGREHPLHAAAGSSAGSPCAHKYCRGQLDSPRLLRAELRAPVYGRMGRCRCVDVWRRGVGYGSWRSHLVLLVHASAILCALVKAAGMSMLAHPGITKLLECGTTEAGVDADAAASDNVKMLRERGTNGGSVWGVPRYAFLPRKQCQGGIRHPKKGPSTGLCLEQSWGEKCSGRRLGWAVTPQLRAGGSTIETEKEKHFTLYPSPLHRGNEALGIRYWSPFFM